jgi:hypothetical protein
MLIHAPDGQDALGFIPAMSFRRLDFFCIEIPTLRFPK